MPAATTTTLHFAKTRKGKVRRVVRERYLREDVSLGVSLAQGDEPVAIASAAAFESALIEQQQQQQQRVVLVLDTNIVLGQLDLLETASTLLSNCVVCDTVLRETASNNLAAKARLVRLLRDPSRFYVAFANENNRETFVDKLAGESDNDYNDRLIRGVARFFASALSVRVVLVSDDEGTLAALQREGGCEGCTMARLIGKDAVLMERLALRGPPRARGGPALYPEHVPRADAERMVKTGELKSGVLHMAKRKPGEDEVEGTVQLRDARVEVKGWLHVNRAVEGDKVAVARNAQGDCHVVAVLRRNWRALAGALVADVAPGVGGVGDGDDGVEVRFVPVDTRYPSCTLVTRQLGDLLDQRVVVQMDAWDRHSALPQAHLVRVLGRIGDKATETQTLLVEHDIASAEFSRAVLACLPALDWRVSELEAYREDLRDVAVCSIDPPGCKDIDDALHCRAHPQRPGNLEVGVHIADVSHFVLPGSAMDAEAAERCTSTYLVGRRLDMLPSLLTTDVCSLVGNADRYAFSVLWEFTPAFEIAGVRFTKSAIRSRAAMTYDEAQAIIDATAAPDPLNVRLLNEISKSLKRKRAAMGALTLASQEVKFALDEETQDPTAVSAYEHKESHSLVEELMLLANVAVAHKIETAFPRLALLRRHPPPSPASLDQLRASAAVAGVQLDTSSSKALADSLDAAQRPGQPFFNSLLRIMTTRAMMQATYFCSGDVESRAEYRHYGLACDVYTHFTSPIRRYADVVVHRQLAAALGLCAPPVDRKEALVAVCDRLNRRHTNAQRAGRASSALNTVLYFSARPPVVVDAYVCGIREGPKVEVMIPEFGLEEKLELEGMWAVEGGVRAVQTSGEAAVLELFQKVRVTVGAIDVEGEARRRALRVTLLPGKRGGVEPVPAKRMRQ